MGGGGEYPPGGAGASGGGSGDGAIGGAGGGIGCGACGSVNVVMTPVELPLSAGVAE